MNQNCCIFLLCTFLAPLAFGQSHAPRFSIFDRSRLQAYGSPLIQTNSWRVGSTYIPMDSWVYPALDRLHGLGCLDTAYFGLRPWTWNSVAHMLEETEMIAQCSADPLADQIANAVHQEVRRTSPKTAGTGYEPAWALESAYVQGGGIVGTPLRDSYHVGQTLTNDYGRPYAEGVNGHAGASVRGEWKRFSVYFRGEYQHAPGWSGYPYPVFSTLSSIDEIPVASNPRQDTIPLGPLPATNAFRILEADAAVHLAGHEISIGKHDQWTGPAKGGAMLWSTNAEPIYAFEINRVEPLYIPLLSRITGPFRYEFVVGSLKGHTDPNSPWIHSGEGEPEAHP